MKFIDIRGTSQENIAKEVEEVAKRRGLELNFQVCFKCWNDQIEILFLFFLKDFWKFRSRLVRGRQPIWFSSL